MIDDNKFDDRKVGYVVSGILVLIFCATYVYVFIYSGRDGYNYTVATVADYCMAPGVGDRGYLLEYKVKGEVWRTGCLGAKKSANIGSKYLILFARANPKYITVQDYELFRTDLTVPDEGWTDPPFDLFEKIHD